MAALVSKLHRYEEIYSCPVTLDLATCAVRLTPCQHLVDQVAAESLFGLLRDGQVERSSECPLCRKRVSAYFADKATQSIVGMLQEGKVDEEKFVVNAFTFIAKETLFATEEFATPEKPLEYFQKCKARLLPHQELMNDYHASRKTQMTHLCQELSERMKGELCPLIDKSLLGDAQATAIMADLRAKDSLPLHYLRCFHQAGTGDSFDHFIVKSLALYPLQDVGESISSQEFSRRSKERENVFDAVLEEIVKDFKSGFPHSFEIMGYLFGSYSQGGGRPYFHNGFHPFNNERESLTYLTKLAALGVKEAQNSLAEGLFERRVVGKCLAMKLSFSPADLIALLSRLFEDGSAVSTVLLSHIFYYNRAEQFKFNLLDVERIRGFKALFKNKTHPLSKTQVNVLMTGTINGIPYPLSQEERLLKLQEGARSSAYALDALYRIYEGDLKERETLFIPPLSAEERLEKMKFLRDYDPDSYAVRISSIYLGRSEFIKLNFTKREQIEKIELLFQETQSIHALNALCERSLFDEREVNALGETYADVILKMKRRAYPGDNRKLWHLHFAISRSWGCGIPLHNPLNLSEEEKITIIINEIKSEGGDVYALAKHLHLSKTQSQVLYALQGLISFGNRLCF